MYILLYQFIYYADDALSNIIFIYYADDAFFVTNIKTYRHDIRSF